MQLLLIKLTLLVQIKLLFTQINRLNDDRVMYVNLN